MAPKSDQLTNKSDRGKVELSGRKKMACWLSLLPPTCYTHMHPPLPLTVNKIDLLVVWQAKVRKLVASPKRRRADHAWA